MSSPKNVFVQDPQAQLDYQWNWFDPAEGETVGWLAAGETITAFTVVASSADLVIGNGTTGGPAVSQAGGKVTAWLSGGIEGTRYEIACHITTNAGRQDDRTIYLRIADQ